MSRSNSGPTRVKHQTPELQLSPGLSVSNLSVDDLRPTQHKWVLLLETESPQNSPWETMLVCSGSIPYHMWPFDRAHTKPPSVWVGGTQEALWSSSSSRPPGLQTSRPPDLQASRPPDLQLQASRPPGLQDVGDCSANSWVLLWVWLLQLPSQSHPVAKELLLLTLTKYCRLKIRTLSCSCRGRRRGSFI